jgi:iron complex outermembrane receptor protein
MVRHGLVTTTAAIAFASASLGSAAVAQTGTPVAQPTAPANAAVQVATVEPQPYDATTVTVLSSDSLAEHGLVTTRDLLDYVPNAVSANFPGIGAGNIDYIRGLGTTSTAPSVDAPVTTSIDGVFLPRQSANSFGFFDLSTINVRRGPQGTTGGRNSSGGTIDVRLAEPGDRLAGYFEGGYGSYQRREFRGSLDIPFSTGVAVKLSGFYNDDHGYGINSTTRQRNNDGNGAGLRGAVKLTLSDELSWTGSVAYLRNDADNFATFDCDPRNVAKCKGRFLTSGLRQSYDTVHPSPFIARGVTGRKAGFGAAENADTTLATSTFRWAGDGFHVAAITGYVDLRQKYAADLTDGRNAPSVTVPFPAATGYATGGFTTLSDGSSHQFSQEIRLDGKLFGGFIDYVVGAYYSDEGDTTDVADFLTTATAAVPPARVLADRTLRTSTKSTAGYAQADANLTDAFKLTAGVRYTDESKTLGVADNRAGCVACLNTANLVSGGTAIPTTQSAKLWTPRVGASYQLPGVLVFASATRGFTSGGWNTQATTAPALLPYDAARNWTYEGGLKSDLFDHRLRVAATGFYIDASRVAVPAAGVDPATGALAYTTASAGLRNYGAEVEATVVPFKSLNLFANLGYQHARYRTNSATAPDRFGTKAIAQQQADCRAELAAKKVPGAAFADNTFACGIGIVATDGSIARPVYTPDYSATVGGTFDYAIPAAGIILQPGGSVVYRSSFETGAANASLYTGGVTGGSGLAYPANPFGGTLITGSRAKSYVVANAALALKTDDNNWVLSIECNNCLDRNYVASSLGTVSYLAPPRTWLVHAKRTF